MTTSKVAIMHQTNIHSIKLILNLNG